MIIYNQELKYRCYYILINNLGIFFLIFQYNEQILYFICNNNIIEQIYFISNNIFDIFIITIKINIFIFTLNLVYCVFKQSLNYLKPGLYLYEYKALYNNLIKKSWYCFSYLIISIIILYPIYYTLIIDLTQTKLDLTVETFINPFIDSLIQFIIIQMYIYIFLIVYLKIISKFVNIYHTQRILIIVLLIVCYYKQTLIFLSLNIINLIIFELYLYLSFLKKKITN